MASFGIKQLCTPSYVYLVLSVAFLLIAMFQNYGNSNIYCLGSHACDVSNTSLIFVVKFIYILFWTWILNLMCNAGATSIAWFLVLLPFIIMFIMISLLMF
jgi:hypothetical protein